jgi:hypothetical protein
MPTTIGPIPDHEIEPAVQQPQLGRAGRELEEAEGGAEEGEPVIGHGSRISAEPAGVI